MNVSGVESGVETEPTPSKAVTNGGASAERSWATVVRRRGNQQRSGCGGRGKEVIQTDLVLTGTTVHIKTESTKAKEAAMKQRRNIQPGAEP